MGAEGEALVAVLTFSVGVAVGYVSQRYVVCFISPLKRLLLSPRLVYYQVRSSINEFLDESVYPSAVLGSLAAFLALMLLGYGMRQPYVTVGRIAMGLIGAIIFGYVSAAAGGCPLHMHWKAGEGDKRAWGYLLGFYLGVIYFYLFLEGLIMELIR
jgi:FtsH-binding integral membrane protein